jgi:hypothetical protein
VTTTSTIAHYSGPTRPLTLEQHLVKARHRIQVDRYLSLPRPGQRQQLNDAHSRDPRDADGVHSEGATGGEHSAAEPTVNLPGDLKQPQRRRLAVRASGPDGLWESGQHLGHHSRGRVDEPPGVGRSS